MQLHGGARHRGVLVALVAFACLACWAPISFAAEADEEGLRYFETHVRPLLAEHCYECHSEQAKKRQGGLWLDRRSAWMEGGDSGQAVVPGNPDESLIVKAVRYDDDTVQMPPQGKLPNRDLQTLIKWVKLGAPDPRESAAPAPSKRKIDIEAGRQHWAFLPVADPPVPEVNNAAWPTNSLDHFILAALQAKGLAPAPAADKRTLIRRVTFDLTGLPPTPAEIADFLNDDSPQAFARVVDRLLDSPHYGERWGRHWLDVARYSDSNGLDENIAHGNAWRYRDYVVDAFNADKPFDQFVREQLAGDLLPATGDRDMQHQRLIATGFLSLGPKVLAEVDETKMEMDIVDEQITTVGTALLGLTLGCARCHDHKFDPVLTADYYGLAGIFKSTRTMESFKKIARWNENPIPRPHDLKLKAQHDEKVAAKNSAIAKLVAAADALLTEPAADTKAVDNEPKDREALYPAETKKELKRLRDELGELEKSAPEMPTAMSVSEGDVMDVAVHIRGSHLNHGELVPRRFPLVLAGSDQPALPTHQSGRLELAEWLTGGEHPLLGRVIVNRIWRWHFGSGLVPTPDNFGTNGEPPINGPLLDWLTTRFVEDGWSIKRLHRLILLSSTYRMSSRYDDRAAQADPENQLLWRFNVQRLEAEQVRDALLAVGGRLDRSMGGSMLHVKNREFLFNHTSQDGTKYDSPRRSLYLPVVRNHLYDVFQLFDYPDPAVAGSDRAATVVAPQALFMMNSELVWQAAGDVADSLLKEDGLNDTQRTRLLYETCLGRVPSKTETSRAANFLAKFEATEKEGAEQKASKQAWQALCQVVLASNEFLYVN